MVKNKRCFVSLRLGCWTLSGRRLDNSAVFFFFLSCFSTPFWTPLNAEHQKRPSLSKRLRWRNMFLCGRTVLPSKSCFTPNSFSFSSQENLVLAPTKCHLETRPSKKEPNKWKGRHGFRLVRKQTNNKTKILLHLALQSNFEKSSLHTVCVHLPNVQPPQNVHFHEGLCALTPSQMVIYRKSQWGTSEWGLWGTHSVQKS